MSEKTEVFLGTGRRKTSVARVRMRVGSGKVVINGREMDAFFHIEKDRRAASEPLKLAKANTKYDVSVSVVGGGVSGQAGAVRLGVARALVKADASVEKALRDKGMLTRDPRMKERKKYGRKGARKGFQFSKR
jgi:small subunit ribosomal protein S9